MSFKLAFDKNLGLELFVFKHMYYDKSKKIFFSSYNTEHMIDAIGSFLLIFLNTDFEDDEDFIQDTPNSNQHAGRQAFCTTDQVSTGFLQTVSLQCAGQNHQDDRDQLISVCNKGSSDRFQQVDDVDSAKNCCNDSRDDDDGNRFQLNGKTYNNHQYAKQTPIHKNTPSKKFRERTFCHKVGNLYDLC